jgi:hypothetical protein
MYSVIVRKLQWIAATRSNKTAVQNYSEDISTDIRYESAYVPHIRQRKINCSCDL